MVQEKLAELYTERKASAPSCPGERGGSGEERVGKVSSGPGEHTDAYRVQSRRTHLVKLAPLPCAREDEKGRGSAASRRGDEGGEATA